jgi:heme/copper-type cytochrome/quinol oxidase subunit 3
MTTSEPVAGGAPGPNPELLDRRAVHNASSSVTGMVLFVGSEAVFFAAFLGIWAVSYTAVRTWPPAGIAGPGLVVPTIGVVVLLASGAAMGQAMRLAHRPEYPRGVIPWMAAGLACAVIFGVLLAISYAGIPFGVGQGIYESLFYMIIGLELAHVVGGTVLLAVVLARAWSGELALRRDPVQSAAIYWYFVVGLGVVIYAVLYLGAIR